MESDSAWKEGAPATPVADLLKLDGERIVKSPFCTQEEHDRKLFGGTGEQGSEVAEVAAKLKGAHSVENGQGEAAGKGDGVTEMGDGKTD